MAYFVHPTGTPSHTTTLEARLDSIPAFPHMPAGLIIEWRQNGAVVKTGNTSNLDDLKINTGASGDVNFDATDTGSSIDFVIEGTDFANSVVLSNNLPAISGGPVTVSDRVASMTRFVWSYSDTDSDDLYYYRVKVGTSPGLGDIYDSGKVFDDAGVAGVFEHELSSPLAISIYNWQICVSDGEKVNPLDPDSTSTDRVESCIQGVMQVNHPPTVHDIRLDGFPPTTVATAADPVISWQFEDLDGHPQVKFRVVASTDPAFATQILWDSGVLEESSQSIGYNSNGSGSQLTSHVPIYVKVIGYDGLDETGEDVATFILSNPPVIQVATVDNRINPRNLRNTIPTFTWEYADADGDPLVAYEIRVADSSDFLGTDSFIGNVWTSGRVVTPEAHQATFAQTAGSCGACSCCLPTEISPGTVYYFQIQVHDQHDKSTWFTGLFRLNDPPTVTNLSIIPAAPFNNDSLTARYEFVDDSPEVEGPLTEIKWYKDGVEQVPLMNRKTIDASFTTPKDMWHFTVRPHDGVDFGPVTTSPGAFIGNRPPQAVILGIFPESPRTSDDLSIIYTTSDPDNDPVTTFIRWYKDDAEQIGLRNSPTVPSTMTSVGEEWHAVVIPNDGYDDGVPARSPAVKVRNSRPRVLSITVDGDVMPKQLGNPNPTFAWTYHDPDGGGQQSFHLVIGTRPLRTRTPSGTRSTPTLGNSAFDGIFSSASSAGDVVAGDDVFDSGVQNLPDNQYTYFTPDHLPDILFNVMGSRRLSGYQIDGNVMLLGTGKTRGEAEFGFDGNDGVYDVEISYLLTDKKSRYRLVVNGETVNDFVSETGAGIATYVFNAARINHGDPVLIQGFSVDNGGRAPFEKITLRQATEFEVLGGEFNVLSGYAADENGVIKLVGLAGTATTKFPFPTGTYDVEIVYLTESAGSPSLTLSVNSTTIMSFSYEVGARTRRRLVSDVDISANDVIKINATRNGGASARVERVVFRPKKGLKAGARLNDGFTYYASVRVFDTAPAGETPEWSDWFTTRFMMKGSAWVTGVSNSVGWTIEARMSVGKIQRTLVQVLENQDG